MRKVLLAFVILLFVANANAQITSTYSSAQTLTNYASGDQDPIFIFCSSKGASIGELNAEMSTGAASADFDWYKLNSSNAFVAYSSDNSVSSSSISNLDDGCYRVVISANGKTETYTAWVLNSWYEVSAEIIDCTCDYTNIKGEFTEANAGYIDLTSGDSLYINKDVKVLWEDSEGNTVSTILSPNIYNPPATNTTYTITVYDQFNCSNTASVLYTSIVPDASFDATPTSGEAPLDVSFTNSSQNADQYEWILYRSLEDLQDEYEEQGEVLDSVLTSFTSDNPTYRYENSGSYMVKLYAYKTSENYICSDEYELDSYIVVDSSYIDAPNFFTPNGDGFNDKFMIKYSSMKTFTLKIFNRWGKQVFSTSSNNVSSFSDSGSEYAWDGRVGGKLASPGVYFYVVEGTGRDGERRAEQGFFHLFREK